MTEKENLLWVDYKYKMKILYLFAIIALASFTNAEQEIPVQKGGYGFSVGDPYGTL